MSLAQDLRNSRLKSGTEGAPDESYLQYMVRMNNGVIPTNAGGLLSTVYNYGSDLPHDQLLQAQKQNANLLRRKGGRWEGGQWLDGAGKPIQPGGNHFNYGGLDVAPRTADAPKTSATTLPGDSIPRGTPPPTGTPPTLPPVGSRPRVPPPVTPPVVPPVTPPTTAPGGMPPTSGPYTGNNSTIQPGMAPRPSFDPTQLLLALRQSTQGGALKGPNAVQGNLASWLAQAMKMPAGAAQPTGQPTGQAPR